MIIGLTIKDSGLKHKVAAVCVLKFKLSATEMDLLSWLIQSSINNSVCVSVDISGQIQHDLNISASLLSTGLHRLQKKGVIKKSGKTITLNPIFNNIQEMNKLVVSFE
jgi:hypothetical protein